ncbi:MAG: hypothetical protein KME10_09755 [Plectolyngbya sp. WJT66-NPBG17]|jgi:hypothetical protein|nr:hypothetical protein [Plectolyngbya sp. WJT66-NPBG17]
MNDLPLPSDILSELFAEVSSSGTMTAHDCQQLRVALLDDQTSNEEKRSIDRLLYAVRIGRIQVIESHA